MLHLFNVWLWAADLRHRLTNRKATDCPVVVMRPRLFARDPLRTIKGQNPSMHEAPPDTAQPRNPLHGVTLETIVCALEAHYGWPELAKRIPVRCFSHDPSLKSSLKFLRRTPWARERVEGLYLFMLREERRMQRLSD